MFKAFTAGLFGILFSTTLGVLAATHAVNASVPADAATSFTAQYVD